jgi:hypothetical protein
VGRLGRIGRLGRPVGPGDKSAHFATLREDLQGSHKNSHIIMLTFLDFIGVWKAVRFFEDFGSGLAFCY